MTPVQAAQMLVLLEQILRALYQQPWPEEIKVEAPPGRIPDPLPTPPGPPTPP